VAIRRSYVGIVGIVRYFYVGASVEIVGIVVVIRRCFVAIVGIVRHFFVGVSVKIVEIVVVIRRSFVGIVGNHNKTKKLLLALLENNMTHLSSKMVKHGKNTQISH
jgi:hypothetical protein